MKPTESAAYTAKFARSAGGVCHFAEVTIALAAREAPSVRFEINGISHVNGFDASPADTHLLTGAQRGIDFALSVVGHQTRSITITRIRGTIVDTSPSSVAVAAALAVWGALQVEPPADARNQIKLVLARAAHQPDDFLPVFHHLADPAPPAPKTSKPPAQ